MRAKGGILGLGILTGKNGLLKIPTSQPFEQTSIHMITVEITSETEREEKDRVEHLKTALRQIQHRNVKLLWDGTEL